MKTPALFAALLVALMASVGAQYEMAPPQHLTEATEDLEYADLLGRMKLTAEQLTALHQMQLALQLETQLDPAASAAFAELRAKMLGGMSQQEAMGSLGEKAQLIQQVRQRYNQALQAGVDQLGGLLTDEQRAEMAWTNSPARALEGGVDAVAGARQAPDEQWAQFRPQVCQALAQHASQAEPGGNVTAETVGALLDQARAMDDADFAAKRGELAREWARTLMPNRLKQLDDPQFQEQQATQVCHRLLSYPRGHLLVQTKLEGMADGDR